MAHKFKTFQWILALLSIVFSGVVLAQENDDDEEEQGVFEEVVVVGQREIRLIDASVPYTRLDEEQLRQAAPRSVADALVLIPSLQSNNALGNTNNDFRFRGIGAGGTQFLEFQEDGIPITRDAPDFLYRISNTATAGIDVVRGGNAPILRTAAIGAIVNFKYKEGSLEEHEGDVYFQTSDFGMQRGEFWLGGPLSDNLSYSVAGHYTTDEGIRDVGFDANAGSNFYANLKYWFDDDSGHFKVSARRFRENAIVYLGTPLLGSAENPQRIPGGPDVTTGSLLGPEVVRSSTYCTITEICTLNLDNGNESDMSYIGTEFVKSWVWGDADIEFVSRNRYTDDESGFSGYYSAGFFLNGDIQTGNDIVSNMLFNVPFDIGALGPGVGGYSYALPAGVDPVSYQLINQQGGVLDTGTIDALAGTATSTQGSLANGNGLFMPIAAFNQFNPQRSFQQDLELNFSYDTGGVAHYGAVGYYYLDYDRQQNNRQSFRLLDVRPQASRVDVSVTGDDGNTYLLTDQGYLTHNHWLGQEDLAWSINATYFTYELQWENLTVDAGIRRDEFNFRIGGTPNGPVYGNDVPIPAAGSGVSPAQLSIFRFNGPFTEFDNWTTEEDSYTLGVNYLINDTFGTYARYTEGYLPAPNGATKTEVIELGLRYQGETFDIAANLFDMTQAGDVQDRGIVLGGIDTVARVQTDRESTGLEIEANWNITDLLTLTFTGTSQSPEFTSGASATLPPGSGATQAELDAAIAGLTNLNGNTIANQPETLFNLGATYEWPLSSFGDLVFNVNARHVGEVYAFDDNSAELEAYTRWDTSVIFDSADGDWYARLSIHNLTDEDAIVRIEGNAGNAFPGAGSTSDGFIGRSVQGRNITFGVGFRF